MFLVRNSLAENTPFAVLTRDTHKHRKSCTGTDEDSLKALFVDQLVDGGGFADDDVGLDLDAESFYVLNFFLLQHALFGRRNSGIP